MDVNKNLWLINKRKCINILGVFLFCLTHYPYVSAQNSIFSSYNKMIAPDIQSWDFVRYANSDVNTNRGTVTFDIPVYTYQDEDFNIPVSISYAYEGLKPNQQAGYVGLGWHLNAGGVITREVRGIPDERSFSKENGFLHTRKNPRNSYVNNVTLRDLGGSWLSSCPIPFNSTLELTQPNQGGGNIGKWYEQEPDIFHFNFLGYSGSFIFDFNNQIHFFNTNFPQGEIWIDNNDLSQLEVNKAANKTDTSIIIIRSGDGYIYKFGGTSNTLTSSCPKKKIQESSGAASDEGEFSNHMEMPISSWHLTEIIAPNGNKVEFVYGELRPGVVSFMPTYGSVSWGGSFSIDYGFYGYTTEENGGETINESQYIQTNYALLKKINIKNEHTGKTILSIDFNHTHKYEVSAYGAEDGMPAQVFSEQFDYIQGAYPVIFMDDKPVLPDQRLTSITINDLITGKTLKSCDLYCEFAGGYGNRKMILSHLYLSGEGIYYFDYYNVIPDEEMMSQPIFPKVDTYAIDHWGFWNNKGTNSAGFIPIDNRYASGIYDEKISQNNQREPDFEKARYGALKTVLYPTGGTTDFIYEGHRYKKALKRSVQNLCLPTVMEESGNTPAGGIRIAEIRDKDGTISTSRQFYYTDSLDEFTTDYTDSGVLLQYPRYRLDCCFDYYPPTAGSVSSNVSFSIDFPSYNFSSLDKSHIEYPVVIERLNNGSFIKYEFSSYEIVPDYISSEGMLNQVYSIRNVFNDPDYVEKMINLVMEPNSNHTERGRLIAKSYMDNNMNLKRYETYQYSLTVNPVFVERYVFALDRMIKNRTFIRNEKLSKVRIVDYESDAGIESVTTYNHNSHGQKVMETTDFGHSPFKQVNSYRYSSEYNSGLNSIGINKALVSQVGYMIDKNNPNKYIMLSGENYVYNTLVKSVKPILVKKYNVDQKIKFDMTGVSGSQRDNQMFSYLSSKYPSDDIYYRYNTKHRLIEAKFQDDRCISFVWDYNGLKPVIIVENASIDQVAGCHALLENVNVSPVMFDISSSSSCMSAVQWLIPNSRTYIYDYLPFTGVSKMIDPSGRTTTYEYNATGKLSSIRDDYGNPVSGYLYSTDDNL